MARLQLPLPEHNPNYIELNSDLKLGLGKVTTLMRFYHIAKMNGFELWNKNNTK